ncbi:MAG: hypothetical protein COB08_001780 [Rhodobacteraceae bacterium]|nr:hypothetical protein [Paracoccaceae bacterium]
MADIDNIEKRLIKVEGKLEKLHTDMVRVNNEVHRHVTKLEDRFNRNLKDQNRVNAQDHKFITGLENRFGKMDRDSKKLKKQSDPRQVDRNTMKLVDQALKAYDQKKGKR